MPKCGCERTTRKGGYSGKEPLGVLRIIGIMSTIGMDTARSRLPFAAGNFIYIGAADLIPEVKAHENAAANLVHFAAFAVGAMLMLAVKLALEP